MEPDETTEPTEPIEDGGEYNIVDTRDPLDIKAQAYMDYRERIGHPISGDLARVMVRVLPPEDTEVPELPVPPYLGTGDGSHKVNY